MCRENIDFVLGYNQKCYRALQLTEAVSIFIDIFLLSYFNIQISGFNNCASKTS